MGQGTNYKMDICFVIDATGSMEPIMTQAKSRALTMGDEIVTKMAAAGKPVGELRMRVIDYADYASEGDEALHMTDFFKIPDEKQKFEDAIKSIEYENRGGDIPENALEALYAAMMSDWVKINPGEKGRHVIVIITDSYPLNLGERKGCIGYPDDLPDNIVDLQGIWSASDQESMSKLKKSARRLVIFAPEGADAAGHTWDAVKQWDQVSGKAVDPAKGLDDVGMEDIIQEIVRSA